MEKFDFDGGVDWISGAARNSLLPLNHGLWRNKVWISRFREIAKLFNYLAVG